MPDPNFATLLAIGGLLVLGGLFDIGWRRRTGADQDFESFDGAAGPGAMPQPEPVRVPSGEGPL